MKAWRVYVTDRPIRRLDLLAGKPSVVAAWSGPGHVSFFDLQGGASLGERVFDAPLAERGGPQWKAFFGGLAAPNGAHLPFVRLAEANLHVGADGRTYLLHQHNGEVFVNDGRHEARLSQAADSPLAALAYDRSLGLTAGLDSGGKLRVFRQHDETAAREIGLDASIDWTPMVAIAYGGAPIFCCDGRTLVVVDADARTQKRLPLHYQAGMAVCSPDGQYVAVTDAETGVVRIYNGELQPIYQRFANDLMVEARRVQLISGSVGGRTAVSALAINSKGILAFAMSGVVCVSSVARMSAVPRA